MLFPFYENSNKICFYRIKMRSHAFAYKLHFVLMSNDNG